MKYKKYILFGYMESFKDGGVEDIEGSYDTIEEASNAEGEARDEGLEITYIIDRDTWEEPVKSPTPEERIATTTDAAIGMVLGQKETP